MTDENGSTINGTCVIFYERLAERLIEPVNEAIQDWVNENMVRLNISISKREKSIHRFVFVRIM